MKFLFSNKLSDTKTKKLKTEQSTYKCVMIIKIFIMRVNLEPIFLYTRMKNVYKNQHQKLTHLLYSTSNKRHLKFEYDNKKLLSLGTIFCITAKIAVKCFIYQMKQISKPTLRSSSASLSSIYI